jgi:DNA modification methylase
MELDVIYNEDCYKGLKALPDKSIDLVYIDIPYLIGDGKIHTLNQNSSDVSKRIARNIDVDLDGITNGIDYSLFDELVRVMKHIYIYIWCSKDQILDIMKIFVDKYKCTYNMLVWCKTNPTPMCNGSWLPDIEYCLVFKGKDCPRYNDGYELKSKWYLSEINMKDKKDFGHPTIKPLDLVKRHIMHSTQEGDVVLDCFMGSGTTAVACKETNRHYIGYEINKEYYESAINRLNGLTKEDKEKKDAGFTNIFEFL